MSPVKIEQLVPERGEAQAEHERAAREFVERQLAAGVVQWLTPDEVRELGKGCIDGRQTLEDCDGKIPCSPGEEVGETLRQAAAIVSELPQERRMAAWRALDEHAKEVVELFRQYGPYCRHTDDHAHEGEFGCGYLRLVHENPELYAVEHPPFVESLVAVLEQEPRPIDKLVTLKGKHEEQAVLVLKFEGDRVARIIPEFEGTQNFVAIPQVEEWYRSETFPVFLQYCNELFGAEVALEPAREKLESLSLGHQTLALGALAKGKPIIEIVFGSDEQVKSVRTL